MMKRTPHRIGFTILALFSLLGIDAASVALAAAEKPALPDEKSELHVYLLIGQSNMAGRGRMTEADKQPVPGVLTLDKQDAWKPAAHPLHFDKPSIAGVGLGLSFARVMKEAHSEATIGLVPCAVGGTPLSRWSRGGDLYERALKRARVALQDGTLKGVIWHQGEADSRTAELANSYAERLDRMVRDLRDDLDAPDVPFVAGELGRFFVEPREHGPTVNKALNGLPKRVSNTATASSEGLTHKGDDVHFGSGALRRFGRRYAGRMVQLQLAGEYEGDPLGGASKPNVRPKLGGAVKTDLRKPAWVHQYALRLLLHLKFDKAGRFFEGRLKDHPEEAETHFMRGLWHARLGRRDKAMASMEKAIELGLPPGRVIAGPRALVRRLRNKQTFKAIRNEHRDKPVHGPMVGDVTDDSARFWVRTATPTDVRILVSESGDFASEAAIESDTVRANARSDYTAIATVTGLEPDTAYKYTVVLGDRKRPADDAAVHTFRTFPAEEAPGRFTLAFGGGASYVPKREYIWDTIRDQDPLAFLTLGDNVYHDDPRSINMQQYCYYRRQSRPEWRRLAASTAIYSIWDDHDFGTNDSRGGPLIDKPYWKKHYSWNIFRQNWVNPGYGDGESQPGCYYRFSIGDVDFFMLDCRFYRTNPRKPHPDMLGPVQEAWLKDQLKRSDATFKVLVSSVPFDFRTKGDSLDTWNGYQAQRNEIFGFLADQNIEGVLLMSADRHRSDAWRIDRGAGLPEGMYDLYEFNSSRLTNSHVHGEKDAAIFSYNDTQSFGVVEFDTTAADPTATYKVMTIDGEKKHELTVKRSELEGASGE